MRFQVDMGVGGSVLPSAPIQCRKALELQGRPCLEQVFEDLEGCPKDAEVCSPPREEASSAPCRRVFVDSVSSKLEQGGLRGQKNRLYYLIIQVKGEVLSQDRGCRNRRKGQVRAIVDSEVTRLGN